MTDSRSLHIGYLVQQFPPEVGAGPARVMEMATHWLAAGHRVTVFTGMPNRPEGRIHEPYRGSLVMEEMWHGIRVVRTWLYASPKSGFARTLVNNLSFMATSAVSSVFAGGDLDVLIASSPPFFPHLSGMLTSAVRRLPLVLEVRDLWPDYLVGLNVLPAGARHTRALFALERWLLGAADGVVVVTDSFAKRMAEKGVAPERVDIVPNGVDPDFYRPVTAPPPLEALIRSNGEIVVGYIGNFGAGQALTQVIDGVERAASSGLPVRLVLVGDGPDRERVVARAGMAVRGLVQMLPPIPKAATPAFYAHCDVCLVPLAPIAVFQETIPSKIFEIMACERPLIASLSGEAAEIVRQSEGGIVVPPGVPQALADALAVVARMDPAARCAMGARARQWVVARYDRRILADRYLGVLERAVARRRGTA